MFTPVPGILYQVPRSYKRIQKKIITQGSNGGKDHTSPASTSLSDKKILNTWYLLQGMKLPDLVLTLSDILKYRGKYLQYDRNKYMRAFNS